MKCPFCDAEIPDDSRVCGFCEEPLVGQTKASADGNGTKSCSDSTGSSFGGAASGIHENTADASSREKTKDGGHSSSRNAEDVEREARMRFQSMKGGAESQSSTAGGIHGEDRRQELTSVESGDGKGDVEVLYAVNRVFLPGGQVTLDVRLRGRSCQIRGAHLWLSMLIAGKEHRQDVEFRRGDDGCLDAVVTLYIEKETIMGSALADYHLVCHCADGVRFFKFAARHQILSRGTSAKIINNSFNIGDNNVLKDSNIKDNTVSGSQSFEDSDDLARKMNAQPPYYKAVKASASAWRPEDYLTKGEYSRPEPMDTFTLLIGKFAVYVTAREEVKFGRHPGRNDFAVLDWKNNRTPREQPTIGVSREQLKIQNCGDSVLLFTEEETTLLDGVSPGIGGNGGIPLKPQSLLSMGPIEFRMNIQYCKMRMRSPMCINCMANKVQSVTLAREDGLPEGFALVWQCCDLMLLDSSLAGFRLYRRNGGFLLKTPSGSLLNLVCGMNCSEGSTPIRVMNFEQRLIGSIPF